MESNQGDFRAAFNGGFSGVLRWHQLDELWARLRSQADSKWYIYAVGEPPPDAVADTESLIRFIDEVDVLLRRDHGEDYCGVVYVDDFINPEFVKIFDPHNLGVSCGYSDSPPLPGWILSRLPPIDLQAPVPLPGNRRRWWQRLLAN